ncbi:hypothetical protein [Dapis sp. BLCC M229]|uniref:hypothetical protein n=1 Tax=Dapis sp. BLCC M229 TaxID=3400188 RepID=UPI003CE9F946
MAQRFNRGHSWGDREIGYVGVFFNLCIAFIQLATLCLNDLITIKKVIPDVFDQGIKGLPFNPVVVEPLRITRLSDL